MYLKDYSGKKFFWFFVGLLVLIVITFFLFVKKIWHGRGPSEANIPVSELDWKNINYSRVSFFNASKERVSMSIPELWEGKYRLSEEGNGLVFKSLQADGGSQELFRLRKSWNPEEKKKSVCQAGDMYVILEQAEGGESSLESYEKCFDYMIESIKCGS